MCIDRPGDLLPFEDPAGPRAAARRSFRCQGQVSLDDQTPTVWSCSACGAEPGAPCLDRTIEQTDSCLL